MNHSEIHESFRGFLKKQQASAPLDRDIRRYVLGKRNGTISVGYVKNTLKNAYGTNLSRLFPNIIDMDDNQWKDSSLYLATGTVRPDNDTSHPGACKIFQSAHEKSDILLFEQGFLASISSWSQSFREKNPDHACLGYVYDDIAHYFMAEYPNRLIRKLNSEESLDRSQVSRAQDLISRIVDQKVSKYNSQPFELPPLTRGYKRRVLVCDQSFADASTVYGLVNEKSFQDMLLAAIKENPDAEILVKTHPDTVWEAEKRKGYYSRLSSYGNVRILNTPVNPFVLFNEVDTVYVGTSQMGLEALFAGKKVVCFGAPFFSGWGVTDDRIEIPHRHRTRTLEEIFYYFYIWYTIYHLPNDSAPSEIEDVLDFIIENREVGETQKETHSDTTEISIIIPVYGVEKYIQECISSVQKQSLKNVEILTVNDQSTDNSQKLIDDMAKKDPRIKPIILPKNVGQGMARNAGLEAAKGEFIFFLDADDYFVANDCLQKALDYAKKHSSDMVRLSKSHERVETIKGEYIEDRKDKCEAFFIEKQHSQSLKENKELIQSRHFWTFLYRKNFLLDNNIKFTLPQWEERPFLTKAMLLTDRIAVLPIKSIAYRVRKDSTARRKKTKHDVQLFLQNFREIIQLYQKFGASDVNSPLRYHLSFSTTQYLHYIFFGFPYQVAISSNSGLNVDTFLNDVSEIFQSCQIAPDELLKDPISIRRDYFQNGIYKIILSAIVEKKFDVLKELLKNRQLSHKTILNCFSALNPSSNLANAINQYSKLSEDKISCPNIKNVKTNRTKIIIHIGSTKSGSTYIQHFLDKNRVALFQRGVWYPEFGLFWQKDRPHKTAGHAKFLHAAQRKERKYLNKIMAGLEQFPNHVHTIILSSEAFFLADNSQRLVDHFSNFDVEMLVYLRRQDDWANSQYCEFVGGGAIGKVDEDIDTWLAHSKTINWLSYDVMLQKWVEKIGTNKITVRPYEKTQFHQRDLLLDFCNAVGIRNVEEFEKPSKDQENSFQLDERYIKLMLHFNRLPFKDHRHYLRFVDYVTKQLSKKEIAIARPNLLTEEQRARILEKHKQGNIHIAKTFLNNSDGILFNDYSTPTQMPDKISENMCLSDFEMMFNAYEELSGSHPEISPKTNKMLKKKTSRDNVNGAVIIKKKWSWWTKARVTFKNLYLKNTILFEEGDYSNIQALNTLQNKELKNGKYGYIKEKWSFFTKGKRIIKNFILQRPIHFEQSTK